MNTTGTRSMRHRGARLLSDSTSANTPSTARRPKVRFGLRALAALAMLAVSLFVSAGPAAAFAVTDRAGSTGIVQVPTTLAATEACVYLSGFGCVTYPVLSGAAMDVGRTPGSTAGQYVTVDYSVRRYEGSVWASRGTQRQQGYIPAGRGTVRVGGLTNLTAPSGYLTVDALVTWWTADLRWLGRYRIRWNGSGEYRCATVRIQCVTGPGWVWVN